ncbi:MAG: DNA gyrase subunit A, partial [Deltaproteobacteria bacterium]|nr:DNA gyrase subunit A [Deltaproteobacteria bacterium]
SDKGEIMLITNQGMLIRTRVKEVSVIGRNTQGVRLITLESADEKVSGIARLPESEEDEAALNGANGKPEEGGGDAASGAEAKAEATPTAEETAKADKKPNGSEGEAEEPAKGDEKPEKDEE